VKPQYDKPLSNVAFEFNLRRYDLADASGSAVQLMHPTGASIRDQVSACSLTSTGTEDCLAGASKRPLLTSI
jgi:hypothetical protein